MKSAHIKIPYKRYSEFCPAGCTKICQKICQIVPGKLENSNSEDFLWEFVDRANFMIKNLKILVQLAEKITMVFPRNFDRNTFSKNLGNFQKFENLVKILRNFLRILSIGPSPDVANFLVESWTYNLHTSKFFYDYSYHNQGYKLLHPKFL